MRALLGSKRPAAGRCAITRPRRARAEYRQLTLPSEQWDRRINTLARDSDSPETRGTRQRIRLGEGVNGGGCGAAGAGGGTGGAGGAGGGGGDGGGAGGGGGGGGGAGGVAKPIVHRCSAGVGSAFPARSRAVTRKT